MMPEPWRKYQTATAGPWNKYAAATAGVPAAQPEQPISAAAGELWNQVSPVQAIKGLAQATAHPGDTAKALMKAQGDLFYEAKDSFAKGDYVGGARRAISYMIPVLGPTAERYAKMLESSDPEEKAKAVGGTLGMVLNLLTPELIKKLPPIKVGVPGKTISGKMYQGALKPPPASHSATEVKRMVKTGLEERIPISDAGVAKITELVSDLQGKVKTKIARNPNAPINKFAVTSRLGPTADKFAKQVNPSDDLAAISSSGKEFIETQPTFIPAKEAQALKTGTYKQLGDRAYGELKTATVEAQKSLVRGLKEELDSIFPEIKGLNAREGSLLDLKQPLERAVSRISNHDLLGLGTLGAGVAGGIALGSESLTGAAVAGILYRVLGDPNVKSRLAYSLYWASKKAVKPLSMAEAGARVNGTLNLLDQAQRASGTGQTGNARQP